MTTEIETAAVFFAAVWLMHLSLTNLTPPIDNMEQMNWVYSLEWGYHKHPSLPPLPTWLIWIPAQFFGANVWTSYVSGVVLHPGRHRPASPALSGG